MSKEVKLPARPMGEMVLLEQVSATETSSGIALPQGVDIGQSAVYVRAFGPKVNPKCGVKIGDKVMLNRIHNGLQRIGETKYSLVEIGAIVAVME